MKNPKMRILTYLLAAAVLAGHEQVDVQAGLRSHQLACGVGGTQVVPTENAGVGGAELDHQILFIVVGHQSKIHTDLFLSISFDVSL